MPGSGGPWQLAALAQATLGRLRERAELANSVLRELPHQGLSPAGREAVWTARAIVVVFVAIRAVHLSQAYLDLATGWHAYRRPALAAALAAGGTLESCWLVTRSWQRGRLDPVAITADAAAGAAALLLLATALHGGDRTTSLNWMLPYTVGTAAGAGIALTVRSALLLSAGLACVYTLSVWPEISRGHGPAAAAMVNAVSYLGFCAVAIIVRTVLFYLVSLLRQARAEEASRGEQLAAERERGRQRRLIHDSALQTLEAVAQGWGGGSLSLRRRAHEESLRLRLALRDTAPGEAGSAEDLGTLLGLMAAEFAGRGLHVEYVDAELSASPPGPVTDALCAATREALINVTKHAAVSTAVIRAATTDQGVEVTIHDRGQGFDPGHCNQGFGIANSIRSAMADAGGHAEIRSAPGSGTLVRLRSLA